MGLLQKAADLFIRAGVSKEDYKRINAEIMASNRTSLITFSLVAAVFSGVMLLYMTAANVNREFTPIYILIFIVSLLIAVISLKVKNLNHVVQLVLIYAFLAVLLLFGLKLGLHTPLEISATFIALLLTTPLLFCDRPIRMYCIILIAAISFILLDSTKNHAYIDSLSQSPGEINDLYISIARQTLQNDIINTVLFSLISMVACTYTMTIKMKRYSLEGTIRRMAETDQLTGLKNRASYQLKLERMAVLAERSFYCIYADANGLHELNNTQGHEAGDRMLCYVATVLGNLFGTDNVFRVGGDEFVVLGSNTEADTVRALIDRAKTAISAANYHVAMGMTYRERSETDVGDMIKQAEKQMYADKEAYYVSIGGRKPR